MGYDFHITRQNLWFDEDEAKQISETEWRTVVDSDPEMRLCGFAEVSSPAGDTFRYENPPLAEWVSHPQRGPVWFDFRDGDAVVKNPDKLIIEKMKQLARKLSARVQGEEGEFYD